MKQDKVLRIVMKMNNTHNRIVKRLLHYYLRVVYSCDIMPNTKIGNNCRFPHRGLGVVINENAIIGEGTIIEANVCIGGRGGLSKEERTAPMIGDGVLIGANAVIMGPVVIGNKAKIGAGAVVIKDVPANSVAVGNPAHTVNSAIEEKR